MRLEAVHTTLAPAYQRQEPGQRADQAERLARLALELGQEEAEGQALDHDQVAVLAALLPVGPSVLEDVALRGAVEASLIEQGWTPMRTRLLFRSLEQLPDKPKSLEERLVADADSLTRLGLLGFARALSSTGATGAELAASLQQMRKALSRRLHCRAGQKRAGALRDELRALMRSLEACLASPG